MEIRSGCTLGPYEIVSRLGAGGMGEVWRARDRRLDRHVAVKLLPVEFATDSERLRRFEQEARAIAALNHPNLITIYDVGSDSGIPYLAMELLEGETVRSRIGEEPAGSSGRFKSRIPIRKAVDIGIQIAQGLAAAHEKGIIHRDLKPENIFVTADGRVKILDFGLARVPRPDDIGSQAGTLDHATEPGRIIGTVSYMSPEQLRGTAIDGRSDIFAFGAILYEMLTGRRAFHRSSPVETMSAILHEDPPAVDSLDPPLEKIVRRCVEKSPAERFHAIHDVAIALGAYGEGRQSTSSRAITLPRFPLRRALPALGACVLAAAAFLAGRQFGVIERPAQSQKLVQLTFDAEIDSEPSIAPDGQSFVFVKLLNDESDIFFQRVGGETAINLTADSEGSTDIHPAFSPDGQHIAFRSSRGGGGIYVMGATGEGLRKVTSEGFHPQWSPDGKELVVCSERVFQPAIRTSLSSLWRVDALSGKRTQITAGDAVEPAWSPDGKRIAYWGVPEGTGRRVLYTIGVDGKDARVIVDDGSINAHPRWSHDRRFLYYTSDRSGAMNLWRVAIDSGDGSVAGTPEAVTSSPSPLVRPTISADGKRILVASEMATYSVTAIDIDRDRLATRGSPVVLFKGPRFFRRMERSPDGNWLALATFGSSDDLFVSRGDGSDMRRLTSDDARERAPAWMPDSNRILFLSNRSGRYEVWQIRRDGSGLEQLTRTTGEFIPANPRPSPDGKWLFLNLTGRKEPALVPMTAPLDDPAKHLLPPLPSGETFTGCFWSPDGSRIAGHAEDGLWMFDLASRSYTKVLNRGQSPAFLAAGKLLFSAQRRLSILDLATGEVHPIDALSDVEPLDFFATPSRPTADILGAERTADLWMIERE